MNSKNVFFILASIFLVSGITMSQEKKSAYSLSHPIKFGDENFYSSPKSYIKGVDSFKVVAILVQFVEDNDPRSSGNGLFDLSNKYYNPSTGMDTVIDSPPYDSAYFADHLKFLKNYFSKASKGKLNISYDLYGQVINLPQQMQQYSPQPGESNIKLGNLFQDSWSRADSFVNFSGYNMANTAFVIFHAGVGRDVDLTSIYGFDPTPYDIPSVYLGLKNLQGFYGNSYNGIQTSEGFLIQNSLIIPSTELRELTLTSGNFLVELGMNGILSASFGSYLGLPDLFNTATGVTAIGRFGLMDGQSLFSYNGIFPPEPSAWEKIFLGWVEPVVISSGSKTFNIPTSSKNIQRDSTVFKVLMSSKEYFLIENRNRDPENNGQTLYTRNRNFYDSSVYLQDLEDGFFYSNAYASLYRINGNLIDVETFDWSLPGLINSEFNYRGGVLIWHIDENVIDANFATNSINNDIFHRGVDVEEAKGAQEIGVTFSTPFGNITGDGTAVDYWFNGYHEVPSSIYQNAFTPTSYPNTLSYSQSNNNIFIKDFSTMDTLMSFTVSIGVPQISPIAGFPKDIGQDTTGNSQAIAFDYLGNPGDEILVNSNGQTFGFFSNGNPINPSSPNGALNIPAKYIPASIDIGAIKYLVTLSDASVLFNGQTVPINGSFPNCPLFTNESIGYAYIGKANGSVYRYDPNGSIRIDSVSNPIQQFSKTSSDTFTFITNTNKYLVTGNIKSPTSTDILIVNNSNEFILNGTKMNINYNITQVNSSPVLADINSDGTQEIIFCDGDIVYALNSNGVLIDNFPVDFNDNITSGISVADINNDNIYDIIFATANGSLYAYGADGNNVSGFPVLIGPNTTSTPALANLNDTLGIVIAGGDGYLYGFKTGLVYNESKVLWKNYLKDKNLSNNNFTSGSSPASISGKLPSDKVYNWPNPVYDGQTFIRYYINGNASSMSVKILDLSGELVTTLPATAFSNADNEVKWNVSNVQSGIYYGVIEGDIDGSTETQIIKIAVVK